jgi:DNA-binding transcriptional LysR family regulator
VNDCDFDYSGLRVCPKIEPIPHAAEVSLMSVELRHLRYFIALAEAKSFGRAAAALGIAQPALSQQIRRLESELDVVLFVRGNDGSHLTAAGEAFLPGATASIADAARAVASAQRAGRGDSGQLKVGFIGSSADNLIPIALRLFAQERPDVEISLVETDLAQLLGCFEREELDVAFVRRPVDDPRLLTELVAVDDVVAVLPADHPLAARQSIPLAALAKEAWVVPPASASRAYRELLLADCSRSGFEPMISAEATTPEAIIGLVAAGTGVSMLPKGSHSLPREGVCTVPIQGEESVVVMAWREDRRTPIASIFMSLARQVAHPDAISQSGASSPRGC